MISSNKKWFLFLSLVIWGLTVSTVQARRGDGDPVRGGGPFGIGVEIGNPGDWGVVGKLWLGYVSALQPAVKFAGGQAILQLDYLWHNYNLIRPRSGSFPFYIGLGGDLTLQDPAEVGVRVPIGLSYIFGHRTPLDIYAQVVPTLWIASGTSAIHLYGNAGIRFYP